MKKNLTPLEAELLAIVMNMSRSLNEAADTIQHLGGPSEAVAHHKCQADYAVYLEEFDIDSNKVSDEWLQEQRFPVAKVN